VSSSPEAWLLLAPRRALPALAPLIRAHAAHRPVQLVTRDHDAAPACEEIERELTHAAGALLVADVRRSPRSLLPGPFLCDGSGRKVPVGFLPLADAAALTRFASAAAQVQLRPSAPGPLALLGQWDAQVERMIDRSLRILHRPTESQCPTVLRWTADRIVRRRLLEALRVGLGAAIYFGHGRPYGWVGYHGLHARHLCHARGEPTGAMLSLTCHTASRRRVGRSFSESLVLEGVAAAALGAVSATHTVDNWWWGARLCEELAHAPATLAEWLLRACPPRAHAVASYRIIGDPLARLAGASDAAERCRAVWTAAADESPTPPSYDAWLARLAAT